jgi:hypothetical protein
MTEHSPEALVVYQLDDLRHDLEVVGLYTHRDEAEAHQAAIPKERSPLVIPMSMASALAVLREEGNIVHTHLFEQRLDRLAERVSQLTAVLAAKKVA